MNASDIDLRALDPHFGGLDWLTTAVLVLDEQLIVRYANASAESMFATSRRLLTGLTITDVLPADRALVSLFKEAITENKIVQEHDLLLHHGADTASRVALTASPIETGVGSLLVELVALDQRLKIDREEKLTEQRELNRELFRNLAHEVKNPLGGIRGSAQLLERELSDPELREFTQVIVKEADRLQTLVNRMLAPQRMPHFQRMNIHEVLERVRSLLVGEFHGGITIKRDYDISIPELSADPEQLIQAVLNVARNAAEAMQGKGTVVLGTRIARQVTIQRERFRLAVLVSITDNGPGVPPHLKERIFYPLVTGRAEGTGLGLSIAQEYVGHHHGAIEFDSRPGHTCFTLVLPLRDFH